MHSDSLQEKHSEASQDDFNNQTTRGRIKSQSSRASTTYITTTSATIQATTGPTTTNANYTATTSSGYYDADKCRAYIANQIKVSKIDRFATQVSNAMDVESNIQQRLVNVLNMYVKRCAQITHEFTFKCKNGIQRHRLIANQRRPSKVKKADCFISDTNITKQTSISNDLLHGLGVQMVRALLTQPLLLTTKHIKKKQLPSSNNSELRNSFNEMIKGGENDDDTNLEKLTFNEEDYLLCEAFEPALYVKKLDDCMRNNLRKSKAIMVQLSTIRQLFEKLALEHRDNVDLVYAAEEERQAATVTRRSAYNLSVAAIKATSTPVHVNLNSNE